MISITCSQPSLGSLIFEPRKGTAHLEKRVCALLENEAEYIPNKNFSSKHETEDRAMLRFASGDGEAEPAGDLLRDFPPHLARLCETAILSAEQERNLFRAMNYLKYRVNALRSQLDPARPDEQLVQKAEQFLSAARTIRDWIIQANMRLVISVVKKFASPQFSFDELLSDGIETLLQTVEKFDFDRGFRFSTYAYRSIARNAYRRTNDRKKEQTRCLSFADQPTGDVPEQAAPESIDENAWHSLRGLLERMLEQLDSRERFIINGRYVMGEDCKIKTFQSMADELGVSKERVRQLEQRAVKKLKKMAVELGIAEFLGREFQ